LDLVILLAEHDEPTLAAKKKRQLAPLKLATSTPKNRVWGFENIPSGRPCVEFDLTWETAIGSVQYTYRNASGRAEWLSRDPIGESGGTNLYGYVSNDPVDFIDPFGLHYEYNQTTGQLTYVDDQTGVRTPVAAGYAGHGQGLNNPNLQNVPNVGPIPQGTYTIGPAHNNPHTGPDSMNLTPDPNNNMAGRDAFLMHGDNGRGDHSASNGCIIMPHAVRNQVDANDDRTLVVVPGTPAPPPAHPAPAAPAPPAPAAPAPAPAAPAAH
jgi:RHS repeat-associated protein